MKRSRLIVPIAALAAFAAACASGDSWSWKRACGTPEELQVDRQTCLGEAAGLADPSGRGAEYGQDLFRECMEQRGWQRMRATTVLECR